MLALERETPSPGTQITHSDKIRDPLAQFEEYSTAILGDA